jgi:hypothetical protein
VAGIVKMKPQLMWGRPQFTASPALNVNMSTLLLEPIGFLNTEETKRKPQTCDEI